MNIVHVISDLGAGGAPAVLAALAISDASNTHVVICMMERDVYGTAMADAGILVHELRMPRGLVTPSGLLRCRRLLRELQPDVVQTWMYHGDLVGGLLARSVGLDRVCWGIHNSDLSAARTPWRSRWVARLCATALRGVPRRIISCSRQAARAHAELGYPSARMHVVPNGYDLGRFTPDEAVRAEVRAELELDKRVVAIGMVARWHPIKDHATLCAALVRSRALRADDGAGNGWRLVLVGPGMSDDNPDLVELLREHDLLPRTLLLGERCDVPRCIAALDLHVLSSAGEAFPNALAEAMACGVPSVTTDVGDAALIADDATLVVPPQDPEALAEGIDRALARIALAGRQGTLPAWRQTLHASIASRYSLAAMVRGYTAVWSQVTAAAAQSAPAEDVR